MARNRSGSIAKDMARLLERDPGLRCAYCATELALPFTQTGTGHLEWEDAGWELTLLPDGEGVWQRADGRKPAHRDHVDPFSKGGADDLDNLVLACDDCNMEKKARPLLLFMAIRAGFPRFKSVGGDFSAVFAAAWSAA